MGRTVEFRSDTACFILLSSRISVKVLPVVFFMALDVYSSE